MSLSAKRSGLPRPIILATRRSACSTCARPSLPTVASVGSAVVMT
jgi:hypothetical protein